MARKALQVKAKKKRDLYVKAIKEGRKPKFPTRVYNRCSVTGRRHGYMRFFGVSRIVFRQLALAGKLPGVTKSSW